MSTNHSDQVIRAEDATVERLSDATGGEGRVSRRGFLKKAGVTAAAVLVGVPVLNSLFFRSEGDRPDTWREGVLTVASGQQNSYQGLEVAECEWAWPYSHSNPMVAFGIKNITDSVAYRKVSIRIMVLGKAGHLLSEQTVVIPSILPGETCHVAETVSANADGWIGGDLLESYWNDFASLVVLISRVEEEVRDVSCEAWPYKAVFSPRTLREYASVEVTLLHDHVDEALLGDAILEAAYLCVIWRDEDGQLLDVESRCIEGLEMEAPRTVELFSFEKGSNAEVYVRPWRRDEFTIGVLKGVEVTQRRW